MATAVGAINYLLGIAVFVAAILLCKKFKLAFEDLDFVNNKNGKIAGVAFFIYAVFKFIEVISRAVFMSEYGGINGSVGLGYVLVNLVSVAIPIVIGIACFRACNIKLILISLLASFATNINILSFISGSTLMLVYLVFAKLKKSPMKKELAAKLWIIPAAVNLIIGLAAPSYVYGYMDLTGLLVFEILTGTVAYTFLGLWVRSSIVREPSYTAYRQSDELGDDDELLYEDDYVNYGEEEDEKPAEIELFPDEDDVDEDDFAREQRIYLANRAKAKAKKLSKQKQKASNDYDYDDDSIIG